MRSSQPAFIGGTMSSGFDYFGNPLPQAGAQPAAPSPYATLNAFAPPTSAPQYGYPPIPSAPNSFAPNHFGNTGTPGPLAPPQPVPHARSTRRPLLVIAVVVIAGAAAAGVTVMRR
jgi:hypothetical protein